MNRLYLQAPVSAGLILSYKCNATCKHCMYACSPKWKTNWISEGDAERIIARLSRMIKPRPDRANEIGVNTGLHFTGGEPFLNFKLLQKVTEIAKEYDVPSTFIETNCFWSQNERDTSDRLEKLKSSGLHGILISVNPFILENVPFESTEKTVKMSKEVFGKNVIIYQKFFFHHFKRLQIQGRMSLEEYLRRGGSKALSFVELIPMGRACYQLSQLYEKHPTERFFGNNCRGELSRNWHVHVDNYGNYMTGFCGGISLGNFLKLDFPAEIDLTDKPILKALVNDIERLYELGLEYGYKERSEGYISKCHICIDIRRHLVQKTEEFQELKPVELYNNLM